LPDQLFDHLVGEPTRRPIISAWFNNEQLGQPPLDGGQHRYLISGFGDGALVDLCRLTIGSCIVTDSAFRWREIKKAAVSFHPEAYRITPSTASS